MAKPKKSLGQHFLKNTKAIQVILDALDMRGPVSAKSSGEVDETVIEIGPGTGVLTRPLAKLCAERGARLVAIEKDEEMVNWLISEFVNWKNIEIIRGDALIELPKLISQSTNSLIHYKIVGNIPYYITGHLLRIIGELPVRPTRTVLMVQKEVAERVVAMPPRMNLLAAAVGIWAEPKILMTLTPRDFNPPPAVSSAILFLHTRSEPLLSPIEEERYYRFIKIAFKQPRKKLVNNLAGGFELSKEEALEKLGQKYNDIRAQDLSIQELVELSKLFNSI